MHHHQCYRCDNPIITTNDNIDLPVSYGNYLTILKTLKLIRKYKMLYPTKGTDHPNGFSAETTNIIQSILATLVNFLGNLD